MNSIGDVLALTPGPSWHECVAIIQEIAAHLGPGQPLPAPEDLLLESDGAITFGFAGESSRPQVADLASLLETLLKRTEAPQGLRDLASENARDEPSHSSIGSFARALAFYERPNRRSDLQALAGRLEGRSQAAQADRTVSEIRDRIVRKSEEKAEKQDVAPAPAPKKTDRERALARARALAIAAAVVIAATAVSAMTVLRGWNSGGPSTAKLTPAAAATAPVSSDEGGDKAAGAVSTTGSRAASGERAASSDRRRAADTASATSRNAKAPKSSSHPSPSSRAPLRPHEKNAAFTTAGIAPVRSLPGSAANPPHAGLAGAPFDAPDTDDISVADGATYTPADHEVTPPVWYRRQLPSEPSPDAKTGYFDIVIDTNGDVESVRLISPTRRYEERMLMAAAKAWRFRPARLNGQPVKYRMLVPITLTWTIDQ